MLNEKMNSNRLRQYLLTHIERRLKKAVFPASLINYIYEVSQKQHTAILSGQTMQNKYLSLLAS
jgi:hypothetical protein